MKLKLIFPACAALMLGLASCKKDKAELPDLEIAATIELSGDQAIADNLTEDANQVLNEAAIDNNFLGSAFTGGTTGILSCATVTVSPGNFPKNIVINFGTGCTSPNGISRSGKILVTLTDSLRKFNSIATMTFDNYFVRGYKKEGTITWTNTSTAGIKSWHRVCQNGKITAPNGNFWTHFGTQDIILSEGSSTQNLIDDVYQTTGSNSVTNAAGLTRTGLILTSLQKKTACSNIDKGSYRIQGPNHNAVIDFGNGTCDAIATISIDGQTPITFVLN